MDEGGISASALGRGTSRQLEASGPLPIPPRCFRQKGRARRGCCLATDSAGSEAGEGKGRVRGGGGSGSGGGGMDNSLAVFSFRVSKPTPPRRRSHYHPSSERERGRGGGAQTVVLSPSRPRQLSPPPSCPAPLSPDFDESWPSTSLSSPSDPPEGQTEQLGDSVLAKYMARFRQAQPTSRQERQSAGPTVADFWWLQPPALGCAASSAGEEAGGGPTQTMLQGAGLSRMEACPAGPLEGRISPLEASDTSALDLKTLSLQDRAAHLLLRSEISSSSSGSSNEVTSIPVSSEGFPSPSTPFTSDPGPGPHHGEPAPLTRNQVPLPPVAKPEDDILFQWRLRRKMELAQEDCADGPQVTMTMTHGQPKPHQIHAPGPVVANQLNSLAPLSNPQPSPPAPLSHPQQGPPILLYGPQQGPPVPLYVTQQSPPAPLSHPQQGPPIPLYGPQQGPPVPLYVTQQSPPASLSHPQQGHPVPLYVTQQSPTASLSHPQQGHPVPLCGPQQSPAVLCPHKLSPSVSLSIPQPNPPVPLGLPQPCPPVSPYTHLSSVVPLCTPEPSPPAPLCASQPSPQPSVPNSLATCVSPFPLHSGSPETGCKRCQSGAFQPSSRGPSETKRQDHKPRKARNPDTKSQGPKPEPRPGPPLRGALEQVVAARLFPGCSEDSPSPCGAPPSPAETPLPPAEAPPPRELLALASGLLEAAEDSDGTDFEEDALLQVLRARRSELRSYLREVDKRLSKLSDPENLGPPFQPAGRLGSPEESAGRRRIEE
ncbi:proline and serine-rich protein 3 [Dromiciops gliroides]|uniref:proline and serine-rich protein 3 n=1 Tax=Dromiciops gliroides TaxID=33562 RepID=UPI001CC3C209|nr:proline and serine-rich protein 3 [Dromiciops gliroides]